MSFDWKLFVQVAEALKNEAANGKVDTEALLRSAVSRAYFGAFCCIQEYAVAELNHQPGGTAEDHARLMKLLNSRNKFKGVASKLHQLRMWRNDADYEQTLSWGNQQLLTVEQAIQTATKAIAMLT